MEDQRKQLNILEGINRNRNIGYKMDFRGYFGEKERYREKKRKRMELAVT